MNRYFWLALFVLMAAASCARRHEPAPARYVPVAEVERAFGPLVSAGNRPTADQNGTGERVGLFQDAGGTIWGLPISVSASAEVLACAPPALRHAKVTGGVAAGVRIIGSANRPTGWRGGTGDLELLVRDAGGTVRWQVVQGAYLPAGPKCRSAHAHASGERFHYYRLAPDALAR